MQQLVIITGLSGAGKTVVLRSLEDMEFYCVDNLPINMLEQLAENVIADKEFYPKVAVGIDIRSKNQDLVAFKDLIKSIDQSQIIIKIIFLSADKNTVLKRYSETRRRHPLSTDQHNFSLTEAIKLESDLMEEIKQEADLIIDTTQLKAQQLKQQIWQIMSERNDDVAVIIKSFAFKRGVPFDADFVFDARCLPNPYWQAELRSLTGLDEAVQDYLATEDVVNEYLDDLSYFAKKWIKKFEANDRSYITIAIGCTGGQHRSVYLVEALHKYLEKKSIKNMKQHRELN
ncbi:RNase adapter RapZ [Marinicella sp. S1101]|uniref:RNase adapter RapZ n=1 Tax=Marinicella marina TaxID=2996016 RepID=UPI002260AE04|nr:RNase adapter RapZ [Marinicella marina]MCX7554632.1 RNase adapter RapZ [Marinicella marina]MDJ1140697.1 RNase adapter RapZ [Marinicella marina]